MTWACLGAYGVARVVLVFDVGVYQQFQESEGKRFGKLVHVGFE
jgi:hypothetical protein